ncbi:MAG: hypothetical protein IH586_16350, partial [Anaerolineaceae bacterium]|nr:hypothetical protein [Anaerolineaceae bacterium]
MLYPSDFELKIGFDQIREILADFCLSELGTAEVEQIKFSTNHPQIFLSLSETEEFRQILLSGDAFPSQDYYNTVPLLNHLRIENTFPEPEQLSELGLALTTWLDIVRFFSDERALAYPSLVKLIDQSTNDEVRSTKASTKLELRSSTISHRESRIAYPVSRIPYPISHIADLINRILDDKSNIRSSASKELGRIRSSVNRLQGGVEKRMGQIFKEAKKSGWIDEEADVTLRDGRLVIPFRSAHKRKIQGVVHDESATGQTVYVEPVELFEMNNEIRELYYAERREIIRILTDAADQIRPHIEEFMEINRLLGKIDFIRAKARFALDIGAALCSRIMDHPHLAWYQAVHPLLFLAHKKVKKRVVPLDISLTPSERVLVISGPNAGGKSICLKTVGLLQYMLQCGLLPPAREDSEFGIFNQLMIDIGDEQSLENDLSTYTSKLLNMKYFLTHLDARSLFLIDEMGTGTDPSVGGAIAEAALLSMARSGAYGVVTTHYSNLKLLAQGTEHRAQGTEHRAQGTEEIGSEKREASSENPVSHIPYPVSCIQNAAMLFDTKTMKPMFVLKQGKPGSSFAIEIATSIGFPEEELQRAAERIGGSQLDFEQQLQDLEVEKAEVRKKTTELQVADEFIGELIANYEKRIAEVERSKKEILQKAREEAQQLLQDSNRLIEKTIREIRESQADKERTKAARSAIIDARSAMTPKSPKGDLLRSAGTPKSPKG